MTGQQTAPEHAARHRLRLGPLLVVVAVAVALALWLVPGLRDQVRLSASRHSEPYLALSFSDEAAARSCAAPDGTLSLDVRADNRLDQDLELAWVARVTGHDGEAVSPGDADSGVAEVAQGRSDDVAVSVQVPTSGRYDVSFTVAGRPEHLSLVCGGDDA